MTEIIRLGPKQVDRATETIARAFEHDPCLTYVLPNPTESQLLSFYRVAALAGARFAESFATADVRGTSIWYPPGRGMPTALDFLRCGGWSLPIKVGLDVMKRMNEFGKTLEENHARLMPEEHWYLHNIAVHPSAQGEGLGSLLIQHTLVEADRDCVPAYLEATNPRGVPFYRRHGFELIEDHEITPGGPKVFLMRREPKPGMS